MSRIALLAFAATLASAMAMSVAVSANQFKAPAKGGVSLVPKGGCCAKVHNACISHCTKSGGCTGNADCVVLKAK